MTLPSLSISSPSRPWLTRKNRYERAWVYRYAFEGLLTVLLLGVPFFGWAALLLPIVAALALPAWYRPGFRWLAYRASLLLWRLRSLRRTLPATGAVVIASTVLGGWWLYRLAGPEGAQEVTISLIAIVFLWSILFLRVQARKRLFVADFVDHAKPGGEDCGKALAARLRNELSSIASLYRDIDEALPRQSGKTQGLSVSVQDTGADFKEVLGSGFTVPVFGIQLPVGALVSLFGRSWGPRLTGSLHKEGDRLVLVTEIGGGRREGSWRVSTDDLAEESGDRTGLAAAYKLVEQMAYRVLTSQLDIGSPRWEAVRSFTEGLRAYRRVQRTEKDRTIYLRKAERAFIRARSEDNRFVQCHYDLAVVYQQLGQQESAEAAFRQTIEEDPERFDPYLGLATAYLEKPHYRNARIFADKALRVLPGRAAAWNLKGLATVLEHGDPQSEETWRAILESFEMGAALAWRSFCRQIVHSGPDSPDARARRHLAQICTANLAESVTHRARCMNLGSDEHRRSAALFRHALCLLPGNPELHYSLGQALFQAQDWTGAQEAFLEAFGDGLEPRQRALRWAYLVAVQTHLERPEAIQAAYRNFLDFAVPHEETVLTARGLRPYVDMLKGLSKGLDRIGDIPMTGGGKDYLTAMKSAVSFLLRLEETDTPDEKRLREQCELLDKDDQEWGHAQIAIWLAREELGERPGQAFDHLSKAQEALIEQRHPRQIEKQGLQTLIARALLLEAKRQDQNDPEQSLQLIAALAAAEASAQQEPASAFRRWVLSEAYSALKDFEQVSQESETSLALGSAAHLLKDPQAITYLAEKWLRQVSELHTPGSWRQELERGRAFLEHIREIIESQPVSAEQMVAHALVHHWLGRFHCELRECDAGISQLETAVQMGARPMESLLILGRTYAEAGSLNEAKQSYLSALQRTRQKRRLQVYSGLMRSLADERGVDEMRIEILLRLAILFTSTGTNLKWVARLADLARWKMRNVALPDSLRCTYLALHHEILGRLFLQQGQADASIAELERARALWGSASNCYHLARAYEAKARLSRDKESVLRKAADLCDQADRLDLPQTYHQRIDELRKRLDGPAKPGQDKPEKVLIPFPLDWLEKVGKEAEAH